MSDQITDGKASWRKAWRALDRHSRWLVRDAVDRGVAVDRPELAPIAVGRARRYRRNPFRVIADLFSGPRALVWALITHPRNIRRSERANLQVIESTAGRLDEA